MVYFHDDPLTARVMAVFGELPAMQLTPAQAGRLFSLPTAQIEPVLRRLVVTGRLDHTADGRYALPPGARRRAGAPEAA